MFRWLVVALASDHYSPSVIEPFTHWLTRHLPFAICYLPFVAGPMIFVTVGTTDFDALVSAADQLAASTDEEVVVQIGQGEVEPSFARWFRLAPSLEEYYRSADLIITHGGLGTVTEVVRLGVPAVGVSNPDRYDHHQEQILQKLEEAGHLIWCRTLADLPAAVAQARQTTFVPYQPPESHIHEVIQDFLHDLEASLSE